MKKLIYALTFLLICSACNTTQKEKVAIANVSYAPIGAADMSVRKSPVTTQSSTDIQRKIIKEGEISFETKNLVETRKAIFDALQKLGGYIAEENETNDTANARNMYVLRARIPESKFDLFLNDVSATATNIDSKSIRARDVTSEYIDISTHLTDKMKLRERYVDLLKKGNKISDLLEIENKISAIETSIDSTQGQLNYLEKQVEFSSLDMTFYTKRPIKDNSQGFGAKFMSALSGGWDGFVSLFLGVVSIWPFWVFVFFLYFIFSTLRRRKRNKNSAVL